MFIADPARNAVLLVAAGKSGRLREAYLYGLGLTFWAVLFPRARLAVPVLRSGHRDG